MPTIDYYTSHAHKPLLRKLHSKQCFHLNFLTECVRKGQDNLKGQNTICMCSTGNIQISNDIFPYEEPKQYLKWTDKVTMWALWLNCLSPNHSCFIFLFSLSHPCDSSPLKATEKVTYDKKFLIIIYGKSDYHQIEEVSWHQFYLVTSEAGLLNQS